MNNVEISGRLVRDPELRKAGTATVCNFSIAVSMGKGEQKKSHFFDMKIWNDNAHYLAENFRKGDLIECRGFATQESWEKDGVKRSKVVFVVMECRAPGARDDERPAQDDKPPARTIPVTNARSNAGGYSAGGASVGDINVPFAPDYQWV